MSTDDARLFALLERLLGAAPEEREPMLASEPGLSSEARDRVRSLLAHASPSGEFLGAPEEGATASLLEPLALPGDAIDGHTLVGVLGRGGFGDVYMAEQHAPRRRVAVKVLRAGFGEGESRRLRFEGEALARLSHPGIAGVYSVGETRERLPRAYIAMEYVEGRTLDRYLEEQRPSLAGCVELLRGVCLAIDHAHQRGVLHRDLSPRNIIVMGSGEPKVIDFGLAGVLEARASMALGMTQPGSFLGTIRYASPEHLGAGRVDTRSDVYALGVIAYEALTGSHPFIAEGATATRALREVATVRARRPSLVRSDLPRELDAVLLKAIERDPERRYQSARELAADLRNVVEHRPVSVRDPSVLRTAMLFCRRHRRGVAVAAVLALTMLGLLGNAAWNARERQAASVSAVNALDAVVTRVLSPLAPKLGTLEERDELMRSIEPDVRRIAAGAPRDARVARILASTLVARGDIERELTKHASAESLFAEAVAAWQRVRELDPASTAAAHQLSLATVKLGDAKAKRGDRAGARGLYERALAIDEAASGQSPDDVMLMSNLFWSYLRLAGLPDATNTDRTVLRRWAIECAGRMMSVAPGDWRARQADVYARRARLFERHEAGERETLVEPALEVIAAAQALVELDPENSTHRATLFEAVAHATRYAHELDRDDVVSALLPLLEEMEASLRPVADPRMSVIHLSMLDEARSLVAIDHARWEEALVYIDRQLAALESQRVQEDLGPDALTALTSTLERRALVLEALDRDDEARRVRSQLDGVVAEMAVRFPLDPVAEHAREFRSHAGSEVDAGTRGPQ